MKILQTNRFKNAAQKLHKNQKEALKTAIQKIEKNIIIGDLKTGDLAEIRVYKFRILYQRVLLAYHYEISDDLLTLISLDTHENFYKNLKNQLKCGVLTTHRKALSNFPS